RARELARSTGRHPFVGLRETALAFDSPKRLAELHAACLTSARARADLAIRLIEETEPELSIVGFTEFHHAAHQLWHTVEPDHPLYASREDDRPDPPLVDILDEVDRQIGRLIGAVGPETAVMVFSLQGMRPAAGIPTYRGPLLVGLGFAAPAGWEQMSWRARANAAVGSAKAGAPVPLQRAYKRFAGHRLKHRIAQPTLMPAYDWARTR